MRPLFSIITTSHNYGDYISNTIESVLAQSYRDWELIIVDDYSTDTSREIISKFMDHRIHVILNETRLGESASYNRALWICSGEYIANLDSDDLFMPQKLTAQAKFFAENPTIDICSTYVREMDAAGLLIPHESSAERWFNINMDFNEPESWIWHNHLCHSSAVIRRRTHLAVGPMDEGLTYTNDMSFWLRCLASGARFGSIREPLTVSRNHGRNISRRPGASFWATFMPEYAWIAAHTLHPYLISIGRHDLVEANIRGFFRNSVFQSDLELANLCLTNLVPPNVCGMLQPIVAGMISRAESECIAAQNARIANLALEIEELQVEMRGLEFLLNLLRQSGTQ
jgi:glycosyltransferase involved in cell wall biosynthesis